MTYLAKKNLFKKKFLIRYTLVVCFNLFFFLVLKSLSCYKKQVKYTKNFTYLVYAIAFNFIKIYKQNKNF